MTLAVGTRLGPYEILSPIGAGGMGEVYKAKDTRLERTVAVKVLPQHLSASAEVRQRFEREAKTISQLSHPHICALYDVGREGETEYLVMELLEGETLSERLTKGALPLEQTLRYGTEISDALDKAHRQGIVHRDLKPGNVMLTKSGVKLLDFGLAKAMAPPTPRGSLTALPTQQGLTQEGTILGTFQYMAPEQLEGKEADVRSDIFAFGAVLYEMATGKKAFTGSSQASLITAIMSSQPAPISSIQPMTPPALDRIVRTCMAKDPDERWQSAGDLRGELQWIAEGGSQVGVLAPRGRARVGLGAIVGFALGTLAAALGTLWWQARKPAHETPKPAWLSMLLPTDAPLATYGSQTLAFAPDGTRLVYAAEHGGTTQLYTRSVDRLEATPIRDSEGALSAFFSPDSRWLGFFAGTRLVKVPVEGGMPQTICEAAEVRGASWGEDGTIIFSSGTSGLRRVSASGGKPQVLLTPDFKRGETGFYWPEILPGGEAALFTSFVGGVFRVAVVPLKTGKRQDMTEGTAAHYAPSGHLVFSRAGSIFAASFDLKRLELTGPAISVVDGVMVLSPFSNPLFGLSSGGDLAYAPGSPPKHGLVWVDRQGRVEPLASEPHAYEEPRVSPDGKRIAVTIRGDNPDVWVLDLSRGASARLTFEVGEDETAVWTPDGGKVTYSADRMGYRRAVYWKPADGSGAEERLLESQTHPHVSSWSPDGRTLVYTEYDPVFSGDIWMLTLGEKVERRVWLRTPFNERAGRFSPDGHWLAYVSNESGRDEVYVQPFPGPGGKWQISVSGGTEPVWSHAGSEIFYRDGDRMMAVRVASGRGFSAETPQTLFEGRFVPTRRGEAAYDISPDDRRFVMVRRDLQSVTTHLNVILNFSEELKRRVPTGKR
ncbi:MAG TPA: protein kinase [Thermoanaerobaculia bacterium]|nr:protein kinase [Thermoanaerobaculia bacterium]